MTGTDTGFHDKANGAFFPLVHGMELRRVQQRFLASLLRQPSLVPTVLTTGIGPDDFPAGWAGWTLVLCVVTLPFPGGRRNF
jgi:hypothetical protein